MRDRLPRLDRGTFVTDGGMETTLIFHAGLDLPHFASFVLLDDAAGVGTLRATDHRHIDEICAAFTP